MPGSVASGAVGPLVSLIVPAYNEVDNAAGLVGFVREIEAHYPDHRFELVLVDDGSTDGTADAVTRALDDRGSAQVIVLSRNFGSHAAISAGLDAARGDAALTLSADLQEPLDAIGRFLDEWHRGADVVWGLRSTRTVPKGPANLMSRLFSRWFHRWSDIPTYPREGPSQVLLSRRVMDALRSMPERNRNVFGLIAWLGFRQTSIAFEQLPRPAGVSKWTTKKKIKLVLDSFVGFSSAPVRVVGAAGGIGLGLAGAAAVAAVVTAVVTDGPIWGWALVAVVLAVGGIQLLCLSLLGEYLWRAGDDARGRPVYVVSQRSDVGKSPNPAAYTDRRRNGDRTYDRGHRAGTADGR